MVAVIEMIRLLVQGAVAGALLVAVAGVVLIVFGALSRATAARCAAQHVLTLPERAPAG